MTDSISRYEIHENDVIELLRPSQMITDDYPDGDLQQSLSTGRLHATVSNNAKLEVFTSPLVLRNYIKTVDNSEQDVIVLLKELLELLGLLSDQKFRTINMNNTQNLFANICLVTDKLRRTHFSRELHINHIYLDTLYESTAFTHGVKKVLTMNAFDDQISIGNKKYNFPLNSISDYMGYFQELVKKKRCCHFLLPKNVNQIGYDFGFISFDKITNGPVVQLFQPSFVNMKNNNQANGDAYLEAVKKELVEKVVTNIKAVRSLPWDKVGLTTDNLVQTFMFYANTSHIDWKKEFANHLDLKGAKIIILDQNSLDVHFGPMIKKLLAGALAGDNDN